jgi:hypothetical protein
MDPKKEKPCGILIKSHNNPFFKVYPKTVWITLTSHLLLCCTKSVPQGIFSWGTLLKVPKENLISGERKNYGEPLERKKYGLLLVQIVPIPDEPV